MIVLEVVQLAHGHFAERRKVYIDGALRIVGIAEHLDRSAQRRKSLESGGRLWIAAHGIVQRGHGPVAMALLCEQRADVQSDYANTGCIWRRCHINIDRFRIACIMPGNDTAMKLDERSPRVQPLNLGEQFRRARMLAALEG